MATLLVCHVSDSLLFLRCGHRNHKLLERPLINRVETRTRRTSRIPETSRVCRVEPERGEGWHDSTFGPQPEKMVLKRHPNRIRRYAGTSTDLHSIRVTLNNQEVIEFQHSGGELGVVSL
jgi:hypothetical protein